jgi:hypothetical protein
MIAGPAGLPQSIAADTEAREWNHRAEIGVDCPSNLYLWGHSDG